MSVVRQLMHFLGLGPDDEYGEPGLGDPASRRAQEPARPEPVPSRAAPMGPVRAVPEPEQAGVVRTFPREPDGPTTGPSPVSRPTGAVRPLMPSASAKPHVVAPSSFNQAQELGDRFKSNQPVILNLQGADKDLSRRLIDFASGLCYALNGHMERVAQNVYLITPSNVQVSAEDKRRVQDDIAGDPD